MLSIVSALGFATQAAAGVGDPSGRNIPSGGNGKTGGPMGASNKKTTLLEPLSATVQRLCIVENKILAC